LDAAKKRGRAQPGPQAHVEPLSGYGGRHPGRAADTTEGELSMRKITLAVLGLGLLVAACAPNPGNQRGPASGEVVREGGRPAEARASAPPPPGTPVINTQPGTGSPR
jgi:hypothetical protein